MGSGSCRNQVLSIKKKVNKKIIKFNTVIRHARSFYCWYKKVSKTMRIIRYRRERKRFRQVSKSHLEKVADSNVYPCNIFSGSSVCIIFFFFCQVIADVKNEMTSLMNLFTTMVHLRGDNRDWHISNKIWTWSFSFSFQNIWLLINNNWFLINSIVITRSILILSRFAPEDNRLKSEGVFTCKID